MQHTLWIPLLVGVVVLAGCQHVKKDTGKTGEKSEAQVVGENTKDTPGDGDAPLSESQSQGEKSAAVAEGITYTEYQNKAAGYSLQRPEKWYWQHFLRNDLNLAAPQADDVLVIDPQPLQPPTTDWYGQMAVEVGRRDLAQYAADWLKDFAVADATVGGTKATRYEGISLEKGGDMQVIEYHLMKGKQSVRLVYNKIGSTASDEQIFEHLVQSFAWTK